MPIDYSEDVKLVKKKIDYSDDVKLVKKKIDYSEDVKIEAKKTAAVGKIDYSDDVKPVGKKIDYSTDAKPAAKKVDYSAGVSAPAGKKGFDWSQNVPAPTLSPREAYDRANAAGGPPPGGHPDLKPGLLDAMWDGGKDILKTAGETVSGLQKRSGVPGPAGVGIGAAMALGSKVPEMAEEFNFRVGASPEDALPVGVRQTMTEEDLVELRPQAPQMERLLAAGHTARMGKRVEDMTAEDRTYYERQKLRENKGDWRLGSTAAKFGKNSIEQLKGLAGLPVALAKGVSNLLDAYVPFGRVADETIALAKSIPQATYESLETAATHGPGAVLDEGVMSAMDLGLPFSLAKSGAKAGSKLAMGEAARLADGKPFTTLREPVREKVVGRVGDAPEEGFNLDLIEKGKAAIDESDRRLIEAKATTAQTIRRKKAVRADIAKIDKQLARYKGSENANLTATVRKLQRGVERAEEIKATLANQMTVSKSPGLLKAWKKAEFTAEKYRTALAKAEKRLAAAPPGKFAKEISDLETKRAQAVARIDRAESVLAKAAEQELTKPGELQRGVGGQQLRWGQDELMTAPREYTPAQMEISQSLVTDGSARARADYMAAMDEAAGVTGDAAGSLKRKRLEDSAAREDAQVQRRHDAVIRGDESAMARAALRADKTGDQYVKAAERERRWERESEHRDATRLSRETRLEDARMEEVYYQAEKERALFDQPRLLRHLSDTKARKLGELDEIADVRKAAKESAKRNHARARGIREGVKKIEQSIIYKDVRKVDPRAVRMVKISEDLNKAADFLDKYGTNPIIMPIRMVGKSFWRGYDSLPDMSMLSKGDRKVIRESATSLENPGGKLATRAFFKGKNSPGLGKFRDAQNKADWETASRWMEQDKRMRAIPRKDRPTAAEVLYFDSLATDHKLKSAGVRREGNRFHYEGEDVSIRANVDTMNRYGFIIDYAHRVTLDALDAGTLKLSKKGQKILDEGGDLEDALVASGLDAVYAPRIHADVDLNAWGRESAKTGSSYMAGRRLLDRQSSQQGRGTSIGIQGDNVKKRQLADLDVNELGDYGFKMDAGSGVLHGMLKAKSDASVARMWQDLSKDATQISQVPKQGWMEVNNPVKRSVHGQDIRTFPELPEKFYVNKDIATELVSIEQMARIRDHLAVKLQNMPVQWWKKLKTVYNTSSHITNIIGNALVLAPAAGISPLNPRNAKYYKRTLEGLVKENSDYHNFVRDGGLGPRSGITRSDLDAAVSMAEHYRGVIGAKDAFLDALMDRSFLAAGKELAELPIRLYQAEDLVYRFTKYLKETSKGMDGRQAAEAGRLAFGAYEHLSNFGSVLSSSLFGVPFLAFNATVIPQFVKWLEREPMKARSMMMVHEAISDAHLLAQGSNLGEYRDDREGIDEWIRRRMSPALFGDTEIDVTKYIPGVDWLPHEADSYWQWAKRNIVGKNPAYSALGKEIYGKDAHFERDLYPEGASPDAKRAALNRSHAQALGPAFGEQSYGSQRVEAAREGRARYMRDEAESLAQAQAAAHLGIRSQKTWNKEELANAKNRAMERKMADIDKAIGWSRNSFVNRSGSIRTKQQLADELTAQSEKRQALGLPPLPVGQMVEAFTQEMKARRGM